MQAHIDTTMKVGTKLNWLVRMSGKNTVAKTKSKTTTRSTHEHVHEDSLDHGCGFSLSAPPGHNQDSVEDGVSMPNSAWR